MQGDINTGLLQTETEDEDAMKPSDSDMLSQIFKKPNNSQSHVGKPEFLQNNTASTLAAETILCKICCCN
jgi:hypothetical protein